MKICNIAKKRLRLINPMTYNWFDEVVGSRRYLCYITLVSALCVFITAIDEVGIDFGGVKIGVVALPIFFAFIGCLFTGYITERQVEKSSYVKANVELNMAGATVMSSIVELRTLQADLNKCVGDNKAVPIFTVSPIHEIDSSVFLSHHSNLHSVIDIQTNSRLANLAIADVMDIANEIKSEMVEEKNKDYQNKIIINRVIGLIDNYKVAVNTAINKVELIKKMLDDVHR